MKIAKTFMALAMTMGLTAAHAQFAGGTPPSGGTPPTNGTTPGSTTTTTAGTLTDSSVLIGYHYNDLNTALASSTVTVTSAVEVSCPDTLLNLCASTNADASGLLDGESINIDSTSISGQLLAPFTTASGDTFNGLVFSQLNFGTGYELTGFTLSTNIIGLSSSNISFTSSALSINLLGIDPSLTTDGSSVGTYTIALQVSAVPEPSAAVLMLCGLSAVGGMAARRRRQQG
jgi:PEP-CTERM motif